MIAVAMAVALAMPPARPAIPPGAQVVAVKRLKNHRARVTYRPLRHYQTSPVDLVGSIECTPTTRALVGAVSADVIAQADATSRDDNVVTVDGLTVTYTGRCTTTNVFIPALGNIVVGFHWDAVWTSEEVKPVGATFVPWDVDRMTLPAIPYHGDPITRTVRR